MRKNKKQLILKLLNEKILPSYADKLKVGMFFLLSSLLLDYRRTFCWTTEGLSGGLQKEVVLDYLSRRVLLSQVWEGSIPASVPTLRVLSQVWEGLSQL